MNSLLNTWKPLFTATIIILLSGCATSNVALDRTSEEYIGRIVEAGTQKPIEGAVILAIYATHGFYSDRNDLSRIHSDTAYYSALEAYAAQEAVTDNNGEFKLYRLTNRKGGVAFVIFKPGYGYYPMNGTLGEELRDPNPPTANTREPDYNAIYLRSLKYMKIELPMLTSRQNRILNIPAINFSIPYERQSSYLAAISAELQFLDLPVYYSISSFNKTFSLW